MKSNSEVAENRFLGTISTSSFRNLLPKSISGKHKSTSILRRNKSDAENTPPVDSNIQIEKLEVSPALIKHSRPQIKEEVSDGLNGQCEVAIPLDSPVKVVVRVRPGSDHEKGERLVKKVSPDSLIVADRKFCFDSVLDSNAHQEDVFQLVGVPLVKNALAGYNNTILSYGQSGSGKTYTMWGPPSAIVDDPSPSSRQGIVPRIFQMLFSEIEKEQDNSDGKQINYQCRCSFLEIYNEQIGDLLDPTQRNLEIKDDSKTGLYVENLTEEYVTTYDDITQILIKGLSSRKVGATSVNSKSSRSHIIFTCIVESWCKGSSSKCFSSSKTSRISLVDLAGLDRNRHDDVGRQELIEGKKVKKSLSKLGHLVDTLAKGSQSGTHEDVLYKGSCLTHLLRESIGGNSKLTVICAISPDNRCSAEVMRTLRFGQRVKSIRNEPVINEINEDDVNDLSDQIRQLKEELIRAKSHENGSIGSKFGYFNGQNVRDSLNQLRVSLNRSLMLPHIDNDPEEEVNVDMHDVRELCEQIDKLHGSREGKLEHLPDQRDSIEYFSVDESSEADLMSEDDDDIHYPEETEIEEINLDVPTSQHICNNNVTSVDISCPKTSEATEPPVRSSLSINPCLRSSILQEPTLSESPKIGNVQRRSMAISSSFLSSENVSKSSKLNLDVLRQSLRQSEIRSSLHSSKIFPGPTESLAASLQRGLQIIDYHQQNSASNRSSMAFSFEHLTLKPCPEVDKTNASVQTLPGERSSTDFLCSSCQQKISSNNSKEVQDSLKALTVAVDEAEDPNQPIDKVPKDAENDLVEAKKREKELENICEEQAVKIEHLNRLVEQYKHGQVSTSLLCLEDSKNEIPSQEQMLQGGHNVEKNQPEIIKEVHEELDREYGNTTALDKNEKEALVKEIQSLKSKLQSYTEACPNKSIDEKLRSSSLLLQSINMRRSLRPQDNSEEELERERERWTEMESEWISLTDELRVDLESIRQRAEKVEMELRLEKKCTEELDDALNRSVVGHARMIEHYADLQDKYDDLFGKYRAIMEGIAEVKRAAAKAGKKGHGSRAAKALAAELSALRVERERERDFLRKENKSLRIQLRDTAEAVHAAGELLVRLREAEHVATIAEENCAKAQQESDKLKKQMEKLKRKHKMEAITMKQYLAESKLPESALQPLYREDSDITTAHNNNMSPHCDDDQAWRAEFGAIYQEHY